MPPSTTTTGANAVAQLQLASSWTPKTKTPSRLPLISLMIIWTVWMFCHEWLLHCMAQVLRRSSQTCLSPSTTPSRTIWTSTRLGLCWRNGPLTWVRSLRRSTWDWRRATRTPGRWMIHCRYWPKCWPSCSRQRQPGLGNTCQVKKISEVKKHI